MTTSKKVLVTGADGFIGSHLVEQLVSEGYSVRAMVLYNSIGSWGWLDHSNADVKQSVEVVAGDIRDALSVREAMRGCEIVFHLAALIAIPYSYRAPESYVDTNIKGTLNVLQAARDLGNIKVIQTSTSEVYGTAQFVPITELHPLNAQSPYAATKVAADQMALAYCRSFEIPVAIVRPFNTYGPRQSARAVIPTIISQIAAGRKQIQLGSCEPTRDFNFVLDVVQGFIAIANSEKAIGEVINVGSNFEISIGDTAKLIVDIMNVGAEIVTDAARLRPEKSEVERLWASNKKAKSLANWQPKFGSAEGLRRGLTITIDWFQNPKNLDYYRTGVYNV
jgi:NAD dependent epimerase/dehydratase